MDRATAAEKAERLNHARRVLSRLKDLPYAVEQMVDDCTCCRAKRIGICGTRDG
jgi:hypothetical protein